MGRKNHMKKRSAKAYRGPPPKTPEVVFVQTLLELMTELQTIYPGLVTLSRPHGHRLLEGISCTLYERLTHITNALTAEMNSINLTCLYRRVHPHTTDLDMISTVQSRVDSELGLPATTITMEKILETEPASSDKISSYEANPAIAKVLTPIAAKVEEYLDQLPTLINTITEEERAQRAVRRALQATGPYIYQMLSEAVTRALEPRIESMDTVNMKMYGEPYMPSREEYRAVLMPKVCPLVVTRSRRMYNCVLVTVGHKSVDRFLALDGTMIGTAKMMCRRSVLPEFQVKRYLIQKVKEFFGIATDSDYLMDVHDEGGEAEGDEGDEMDA